MSALTDYVEQQNRYRAIFKEAPLSLAIAKDRQTIANMIDSNLSPEHLTCDGELSRTEVQRRYKQLTTAARQLLKVDPDVTFYEYSEEIV
jgi:hypothetical protein